MEPTDRQRRIVIRGGTVVTATESRLADVVIDGETVVYVGGASGQVIGDGEVEVIDARGRLILPGGVDVHTHLDMPVGDTCTADDFESGSIAALFGGTTTVVDFANPAIGQPLADALDAWQRRADGRSYVDYAFHVTVVQVGETTLAELDALIGRGVSTFKVFTDYPGRLQLGDGEILRMLQWSSQSGALVLCHAVNGSATEELFRAAAATKPLDSVAHGRLRPPILEGEATGRVTALAEVARAPIYIVHVSAAHALQAIRAARSRGGRVLAETCPQYLFLDDRALAHGGREGLKYVCNPPLRALADRAAMLGGVRAGDIDVVATDHCSFNLAGQKDRGLDDVRRTPNGLPGIESRLALLHSLVADGLLSIQRLVELFATRPARCAGLFPKKGSIVPGADADLVLFDPNGTTDLSRASQHMRVDHSVYEGWILPGCVDRVLLRGATVVYGASLCAPSPGGRFLKRLLPGRDPEIFSVGPRTPA